MFLCFKQSSCCCTCCSSALLGEALVGARPPTCVEKGRGPMLGLPVLGRVFWGRAGQVLPVTHLHCLQLSFPVGVSMKGLGLMESWWPRAGPVVAGGGSRGDLEGNHTVSCRHPTLVPLLELRLEPLRTHSSRWLDGNRNLWLFKLLSGFGPTAADWLCLQLSSAPVLSQPLCPPAEVGSGRQQQSRHTCCLPRAATARAADGAWVLPS